MVFGKVPFVFFLLFIAGKTSATVSPKLWEFIWETVRNHVDNSPASYSDLTPSDGYVYARCDVSPNPSQSQLPDRVSGTVDFRQMTPSGQLEIKVNLTGFEQTTSASEHGFHVHQLGTIKPACEASGSHFNPYSSNHGSPQDPSNARHVGDFGNIPVTPEGTCVTSLSDSLATLEGPNNIIGRAVVIHHLRDDLGLGGDSGSLITGNAGPRLACCIIGIADGQNWP